MIGAVKAIGARLGPHVKAVGESLESAAVKAGAERLLPAYVTSVPLQEHISVETQKFMIARESSEVVPMPDRFVAPSASLDKDSKVEVGASVWYNATVSSGVSIGERSAVLENAMVKGSSSKPTIIGNFVTINPLAKVGAGAKIGDRSVIGSGAVLEDGVTVESDAKVGQGSHVVSGTVVKSRELWAGNPAVLVRSLESTEISQSTEAAQAKSVAAIEHASENAKDAVTVYFERRAFEDRWLWVEDLLEDTKGKDILLNVDLLRDPTPNQRGLIFNKGHDKGNE